MMCLQEKVEVRFIICQMWDGNVIFKWKYTYMDLEFRGESRLEVEIYESPTYEDEAMCVKVIRPSPRVNITIRTWEPA